ncbi:MAG TPA: hypothetical protein VM756_00300 [Burkholderiales bacterium]|jgi:hypothetical protein|nr:hypothetical protein [Burkholderiales bacterium]
MKRLLIVALLTTSATVFAQNRSAELDKAYEEARAAGLALKEAEKRRDEGVEAQAGDRQGSASGGTRPTDQYLGRQMQLEMDVEQARKRNDAALKRWNDLK